MESLSKNFVNSFPTLGCYFFLQILILLLCPIFASETVTTTSPQMHPIIRPFFVWIVGTGGSFILSKNFSEVLIKELPIIGIIVSNLWGLVSLLLALLSFRNCF